MANLKLINGSTEQTFSNVETIKCPTDDGGTQIFETQKERQAKTVSLLLSDGNQEVTADEGKVLSSVTIEKPESLVPENIRSGVDIGGVEGSLVEHTLTAETVALNMADGDQILTAPDGTAYSTVTITKPSTLVPENIRAGVDVGGIEGEYGGEGASSIEWDDITGKPNVATVEYVDEAIANLPSGGGASVSTETEIFGEQAVDFQADSSLGGLYSKGFYEAAGDVIFQLIEGETYFVEWDGETYECVAAAGTLGTANGIYIGNLSIAGLEGDTGEPFLVADAVNTETAFNMLISNDTEASHTVRVYQKAPLQVSWENVTDKPFGYKQTPYTWLNNAVFTDTWYPNESSINGGDWDAGGGIYVVESHEHLWVIGDKYTVTINGTEYTDVVATDLMGMGVFVGNTAMAGGADNGLPFALAQLPEGHPEGGTPMYLYVTDLLGIPDDPTVEHTVTTVISVKGNSKELVQLDPTYIKDMYYEDNEPIFTGVFTDTWNPDSTQENGGYWSDAVLIDMSSATLIEGKKYNLTVNGTVYPELEAFTQELVGIGNPALIDAGEDNGCPVAIARDATGALAGVPVWICQHNTVVDDPTVSTIVRFDVKIERVEPTVHKIPEKYIPTPPEFDLTAMGLPAVSIGSYSQLDDVDVTDICTALGKGPVKFTFAFNYEGTEIPAVYLGLGISALGGWQSNCILNFQGAPVFGSLIFDQTNRQITARITPLGVAA